MTDSVHNLNGLVHIFERASLDVSEALLTSSELTTVRYEKRMKPYIIGMIDYLRQDDLYADGVDVVAWQYLLEKTQDDLLKEVDLLDDIRLVDGVLEKFVDGAWVVVGDVLQDCADVEPCIDASPSITNINNSITTINQTTQDLQDATQDLQETTDKNEYPPSPTIASEPDILCASSWYIARELDSIIQQLILGTDFQNIQEFIAYWLFDGGWRYTSLSEIWALYNTLNNPSLSTEISSAIEFVAEIFYCNELNRDQATIDIQESTDISVDAKALYIAVIEAWTNSKFALATAIGRDQASEDCTGFCAEPVNIVTFDAGGYPYDNDVELKVASTEFTLASGNVARKSASSGSTAIDTRVTSRYTNIYIDSLVFDAWAFMNTNDEQAMELQYRIELYAGNGGGKFLDTGFIQIDNYDPTSITGQVSRQKHVEHDFGSSQFIRAIITTVRVVGSGGRGTQVDNIGVILTP